MEGGAYDIGETDIMVDGEKISIDHIHYKGPENNKEPKIIEIHLHGNGSSYRRAEVLAENAIDRKHAEVYCPNIPLHSGKGTKHDIYRELGRREAKYIKVYIEKIMDENPDAKFIIKGQSAGGSIALHMFSKLDPKYVKNIKCIVLNSPLPPDAIKEAIENTPIIGIKLVDSALALLIKKAAGKYIRAMHENGGKILAGYPRDVYKQLQERVGSCNIPIFIGCTLGDTRIPIHLIREKLSTSLKDVVANARLYDFQVFDESGPKIPHVATALLAPQKINDWMEKILERVRNT